MSYAEAQGCDESIEATAVCKRQIYCTGFVARMGDNKLPKIALLGEVEGCERLLEGTS